MKKSAVFTILLSLAFAHGKETPPDEVAKRCSANGEYAVMYMGRWNCLRCAEVPYVDPKTGYSGCCELGTAFLTDKAHPTEGACCTETQIYSYNPKSATGACCAADQVFTGDACVVPDPAPDPGPTPGPAPAPRCPTCTKDYACACDGTLGIKYGHCYTMTDVNGLHLNREISGTYQSGGDIDNLIFRVCKSTDDCSGNQGQFVPDDGTWYLQDQLGSRGGKGPGWFGNISPHMGIVEANRADRAAKFKGEGFCMFGDCAICLRLTDSGLSAPCPMGAISDKAHIGRASNPNNCKAYRFQEVKCVKGV